jgi:hypothetical protein
MPAMAKSSRRERAELTMPGAFEIIRMLINVARRPGA